MSSLVLDLQQEVLKPDCDILNALRKAHLIAAKLKLAEFDSWIMSELNGYKGGQLDFPQYRIVRQCLHELSANSSPNSDTTDVYRSDKSI